MTLAKTMRKRTTDGRYGLLLRSRVKEVATTTPLVTTRREAVLQNEPEIVTMADGSVRLAPLEWASELSDESDS